MTLTVRVHPAAAAELDAAIAWYDQGGQGRGDRFEAAFDDVVERCVTWPDSGAPYLTEGGDEVRSARVAGSRYRVVYVVIDDVLWVVALAHQRRRPGYWQHRVTSLS